MKKIGQNESIAKRITCDGCGAILEYYPKEVKYQDLGDMDWLYYIKCCECKKQVYVPNPDK